MNKQYSKISKNQIPKLFGKPLEKYNCHNKFIWDHLLGHVFHVTSLAGAIGILKDEEIKANSSKNWKHSSALPPMNLQLNRVSLFNLTTTTGEQIKEHFWKCWPWPTSNLDIYCTRVFFLINHSEIRNSSFDWQTAIDFNHKKTGVETYNKGVPYLELYCEAPIKLDKVNSVLVLANIRERFKTFEKLKSFIGEVAYPSYIESFWKYKSPLEIPTKNCGWNKQKIESLLLNLQQYQTNKIKHRSKSHDH